MDQFSADVINTDPSLSFYNSLSIIVLFVLSYLQNPLHLSTLNILEWIFLPTIIIESYYDRLTVKMILFSSNEVSVNMLALITSNLKAQVTVPALTWKLLLNESQSCLYTQTAETDSMRINTGSWAELSSFPRLPFHPWGVEVSWRPQRSHNQPGGRSQCHFHLAASALWFWRKRFQVWSCECCRVHPDFWHRAVVKIVSEDDRCSYCWIFILKPYRKIIHRR